MQTPAGYEVVGDKAVLTDFWAAVFNPSTLPRYFHTVASAWAVGAFLVVGVAAWYLLQRPPPRRGRDDDPHRPRPRVRRGGAHVRDRRRLRAPGGGHAGGQVRGDAGALLDHQRGAARDLLAAAERRIRPRRRTAPSVVITRLLSFLAFGNFEAAIKGLEAFPTGDWPPVPRPSSRTTTWWCWARSCSSSCWAGCGAWWRGRLETLTTMAVGSP